jgi:hypothetical protein
MKTAKNTNVNSQKTLKTIVDVFVAKKEIKSRFQNGEKLRAVTKEKGFEVVLPL